MHPEEYAFRQAVVTTPGDDTVRLAFADWLDEHSCGEYAEFVRVQCELARDMPAKHRDRCNCKGCQLRRRSGELLIALAAVGLLDSLPGHVAVRLDEDTTTEHWQAETPPGPRPYYVEWSRGFVSRFEGTAADWLRHADAMYWHPSQTAECPLTYEEREAYSCDVCGNVPDEDGRIEHGKGCYTQDEDGGGTSWVELPERRVPRPMPSSAQPISDVTLTDRPDEGYIRGLMARMPTADLRDLARRYTAADDRAKMTLEAAWPGVTFSLPAEEPPITLTAHTLAGNVLVTQELL